MEQAVSDIDLYFYGIKLLRKRYPLPLGKERPWSYHDVSVNALLKFKRVIATKNIERRAYRSYFAKVALSEAIAFRRNYSKLKSLNNSLLDFDIELIDTISSSYTESDIENEELFSKIRLAITKIKPDYWIICRLAWVFGIKEKNIATHQQCSISKVRTALRTTRLHLITELREYCG